MRSVETASWEVMLLGRLGERWLRMSMPQERERKAMGKWTAAGWTGLLEGLCCQCCGLCCFVKIAVVLLTPLLRCCSMNRLVDLLCALCRCFPSEETEEAKGGNEAETHSRT